MNLASRGFAAAGTDNAHQSERNTSASWALGHPEKFVDYGWRSLKETTDVAKALIAASKETGPTRSYFSGCSDGGREALMEAQRFPADFDGIIAGAPANNMTRLLLYAISLHQAVAKPGGHITPAQFQMVQQAVIEKCGGGSFVRDPERCTFDSRSFACKKGGSQACLAPPQVNALSILCRGLKHPRTGKTIAPGFPPGGEAMRDAVNKWTLGMTPAEHPGTPAAEFAVNAAKYFFKGDDAHDIASFDMAADADQTIKKAAPVMDSTDVDLSAFKKRGGKLLHYHGWNDQAIPAKFSTDYYDAVRGKMGDVSDFYKLYMLPGMLHCSGGAGPSGVDWIGLLDGWVERGKAPVDLTAMARNPSAGAVQSQRLCPYPQVARPSDGDPNTAEPLSVRGAEALSVPPARRTNNL